MINPDSELRLSQALVIAGESEEQRARKLKMVRDLSKGFKTVSLIPGAIRLNSVRAVTRFKDDLFRVTVELYQEKEWEKIQKDRDVYGASISRISIHDPIDEAIDRGCWTLNNMPELSYQSFHPERGGEVTEEEFWRRYMSSEFDPRRTFGWSVTTMADLRGVGNSVHTLTWLFMEPRRTEPK
ncbi:MAG: hypothetical protein A2186_02205 [Candidatus Levybacteria bacterium RIFOXYA1_FULL_41_10]|nr:MAG: hypothetical protein UT44_C0053G0008 [Candidatus Levybacteria bacterium GW2011_GWA1_39_32]KKR95004.1 MAG: hypothetical protein UU45_C0005G0062 [Candidatus Levybacteria bacterium GW2011_GWA2_41_15]OGH21073.1 MAG: hypothetical protein A2695_01480 [Candidatus Levybacteria bacterium RIFCSPHIGHO2_01_FULL_40_83]OGH31967.1 MAG: hypothetical protein A3E70_03035 [Candidatus Levybacteria bacterium RIFCSPHIGHO2_12_FULL_40_44]OGH41064.1 MAG: hypothetical protein A2965_01300 [Candidatus Levybacteria